MASTHGGFMEGQTSEGLTEALNKYYDFEYLAEGRANTVFVIRERPNRDASLPLPEGTFVETLLRVPKITDGIVPCDYDTLQRFHEGVVVPQVGGEHVVPQILVKITEETADKLDRLRKRDSKKARAAEDTHIGVGSAMLIQNMSESPEYLSLEFKPKWLAQSPLAPKDSIRCRTCAREAFRIAQKVAEGKSAAKLGPPVCPLGLMHPERWVRMATIDRLAPSWSENDRERLADALQKSGLLERLRQLQVSGDAGRALFDNPSDPHFGLTMTLRDCSCFVRMPKNDNGPVLIKLADVDKKNWEAKQTYWQDSHNNLIDNGWYTGKEQPRLETNCIFELDRLLAQHGHSQDKLFAAFLARAPKDD
ncbi:inositol-pentakisphosphate 2-kinase [Microdochium nivale]|nr:inositol-pentakisphosphate 2-kinase [Microdochium nivale]